jgi:ubiquinone/menaquinone biosynthesis C-methylase UbiE
MKRSYASGARWYDLFSGEPFYRKGRTVGVELLTLGTGDVVLDLGCGTGLNFALLVNAVGPTGRVVALDRSADMLRVAAKRVRHHGWTNVELVRADATTFEPGDIGGPAVDVPAVDALIATYTMSIMADPHVAWRNARLVLRRGGRACIVDMQRPTGWARAFTPLALAACALGGSDIDAHPWRFAEQEGSEVSRRSLRGGHIQIVAATVH